MAFVRGTIGTCCVSLIVAVSMEHTFVTEFFPASFTVRGHMIYLNNVSILEKESTPAAFSCLFLKQFSQCPTKQIVVAEPLTPIKQISIIRAGRSPHFDVSLDMSTVV